MLKSLNGGSGTIPASSIQLREDAFKEDADGKYDIEMNYPTGSGPGTFNHTVSSSYDITGRAGPLLRGCPRAEHTGTRSGGSGWVAPV